VVRRLPDISADNEGTIDKVATTKEIKSGLTRDYVLEHLSCDAKNGLLFWRNTGGRKRTGASAGSLCHNGYVYVRLDGMMHKRSRLLWFVHHGEWPNNELDHINRVRTDDRLVNLRNVTSAQNGWNKNSRIGQSGTVGVCFHKETGKWRPRIQANGKIVSLGLYQTVVEAAEAYQAAKLKFHVIQ
jgi:hypothetical protein